MKNFIGIIRNFFYRVRFHFKRRRSDRDTLTRTSQITQSREEIDKKIARKIASISKETNEKEFLDQDTIDILQTATLADIKDYLPLMKVNKNKIFSASELEKEVFNLNIRAFNLTVKSNLIQPVVVDNLQDRQKRIQNLERFLNEQNITVSIPKPSNPYANQFEAKFPKDFSLVSRYNIRERELQKAIEVQKGRIKSQLSKLDSLINDNSIDEAKTLIRNIEKSLRGPHFVKLQERFGRAKERLEECVLREIEKREREWIRKQKEKAEEEQIAQDAIREQERLRQIQILENKKHEEERQRQKEQELQSLLVFKLNWQEYSQILNQNNITTFYHFTDRANLSSIKRYGGLYSWKYMDREGIVVPFPGSGPAARAEAVQFNLTDYVSVSFAPDLPMKYVAKKEGRIKDPITLKISVEVAYFEKTLFTSMNAADNRTIKGGSIDNLRDLHYQLFKRHYFNLEGDDKKYYQAEVLVKTWIPLRFITNINDF